jgi:hypothetical protein
MTTKLQELEKEEEQKEAKQNPWREYYHEDNIKNKKLNETLLL